MARALPALHLLLGFGIPETIGDDYYKFGYMLLQDGDGTKTDAIIDAAKGNPCIKILQRWLQGAGRPVTWVTLIQVLRDLNLNTKAEELEEYCKISVI